MKAPQSKLEAAEQVNAPQRGFTLVELAIATVVLLVGVMAVLQLVPAAMQSNLQNRQDTTSAVVSQRLRELFTRQAITDNMVVDPTGLLPCSNIGNCQFGNPAQNDRLVGAPVIMVRSPNGTVTGVRINFAAAPVAGYNFTYIDPNDPTRAPYDVRWAVVTSSRNVGSLTNIIVAKRVIVGARRLGSTAQSFSFNTLVSR